MEGEKMQLGGGGAKKHCVKHENVPWQGIMFIWQNIHTVCAGRFYPHGRGQTSWQELGSKGREIQSSLKDRKYKAV